eukprot:220318-Pelagomonas_calceolata.AAC.2
MAMIMFHDNLFNLACSIVDLEDAKAIHSASTLELAQIKAECNQHMLARGAWCTMLRPPSVSGQPYHPHSIIAPLSDT